MKKKKLLYFFYNRLNDPLLKFNVILYIDALAATGRYDIAMITYEDKQFPLSKAEKKEMHEKLLQQGIRWYPLTWHAGSNLFLKFIDLMAGFVKVRYLAAKGYRYATSLGSISGSFLYVYSRLSRIRFYLYQYEPHSEYALDNQLWPVTSMQYRALHYLEKKSVQACKVVSSGTSSMQNRLKNGKLDHKFFRVASVVNDTRFHFDASHRARIRNHFGISDSDRLVIYPGKLGELYCSGEQLLQAFKTMHRRDAAFKFMVISPAKDVLEKLLAEEDPAFKKTVTLLPAVSHNEMPGFLTAADLGIVAVMPGPSKQFISSIKVGEYLCSGLPYLICSDLLDDSAIATRENVGAVVRDFSEAEIEQAYVKIQALLQEPRPQLAQRCRKAGIFYRGFERQYEQFRLATEKLIR